MDYPKLISEKWNLTAKFNCLQAIYFYAPRPSCTSCPYVCHRLACYSVGRTYDGPQLQAQIPVCPIMLCMPHQHFIPSLIGPVQNCTRKSTDYSSTVHSFADQQLPDDSDSVSQSQTELWLRLSNLLCETET